jgi:hypothetical protein
MNKKDLSQLKKHFTQYLFSKDVGNYYHKENNFHISITKDGEVYQLNSDHEQQGIELDTLENFKIRYKSFTGENLEA